MVYDPNPPLTATLLRTMLLAAFPDALVTVRDDTHLHSGHNDDVGHHGGHYKVHIIWAGFANMTRAARHRAVHGLLREAWAQQRIHALSLKLQTPAEATDSHLEST
jgi:BolA protein